MCPDSVSDVRVHSRARAGPRAEHRPRRTRFVAIEDDLGWAPTGAPPLQKLALEGDSRAGRVSPSVAGGCAGVGRGKVARWGVRAPTSAVKNSLAEELAGWLPFSRGRRLEFFKNIDFA